MANRNGKSPQMQWSFTYRPRRSSPDANLIEFLNSISLKEGKDMALQAIRAYWNAIAAVEMENKTPSEIRRIGLTCCNMLEAQSDYIRMMLSLPPRVMQIGGWQQKENNVNYHENQYTDKGKFALEKQSDNLVEVEKDRAKIAQEKVAQIAQEKQAEIIKDVMEDIMKLD